MGGAGRRNFPIPAVDFRKISEYNGFAQSRRAFRGEAAMHARAADDAGPAPFQERVDRTRVPTPNDFIVERHAPRMFAAPYHHHTSVEVNFLQDCAMAYSFSGETVELEPERLAVFWGAAPHRVTRVAGDGTITNVYLSLGQFIRWGLPTDLVEAVLSGAVAGARGGGAADARLFDRLYAERGRKEAGWRRMHLAEIETRLRRLALEGWNTLHGARSAPKRMEAASRSMLRVEAMLRFVADNFTAPFNVGDVARAANLSAGRASALFQQVMGVTIKQHLTRARLSHARMLLTETDGKVVSVALDSGFSSQSAFYEAFTAANGVPPAQYRRQARAGRRFGEAANR